MPVYFQQGVRPKNPQNQTNLCKTCVDTLTELHNITVNGVLQSFDSEKDAHTVFKTIGQVILNGVVPALWTALWNAFKCTNQNCQHKAPCGPKPTYIEAGSEQAVDANGNVIWQLYVVLARQIQCLPGEEDHKDEVPEIPQIPPPTPRHPYPEEQRRIAVEFVDYCTGIRVAGDVTILSGQLYVSSETGGGFQKNR